MTVIETQIDVKQSVFKQNAAQMKNQVQDLKQTLAHIYQGGNDTARERHKQHGKLLPRDRIQLLLDKGSDFLELSPLAGFMFTLMKFLQQVLLPVLVEFMVSNA